MVAGGVPSTPVFFCKILRTMVSNVDLIDIRSCSEHGQKRYDVTLRCPDERDRKMIVAQIEDQEKASLVQFRAWSKHNILLHRPDKDASRDFVITPVVIIKVEVPADMDMTSIACYFLQIIS